MKNLPRHCAAFFAALALTSCAAKIETPQSQFMNSVMTLCGKSFAGTLVSTDAADKDFASKAMTMQVLECSETEIKIPFHVDSDHSRTWILSKTNTGLQLKHRHNHENGHADAVTMYGGDTSSMGSASRQTFPVDEFSKAMFKENGLGVSVTNIWAVEITDTVYAYELRRENRFFRVEFDLTKEVQAPPKPW